MKEGERSKTYHKVKRLIFYLGLVLDIAILVILSVSGLSIILRSFAYQITPIFILSNAVYITLFCLAFWMMHLPLDFFAGFTWEHRNGLSNQTFGGWIKDEIKRSLISFILVLFFVELLYVILASYPKNWWILAGVVWVMLTLFLARILPNVIIPMFYKYIPVENQELKDKILALFKECKVKINDVYAIDLSSKTKKANAFVCGLGKKRRVVLSDTLLSNFSTPEIEAVVAHELGHYCKKDILKLIFVNSATVFMGFYLINEIIVYVIQFMNLERIDDIALLPAFLLIFMVFSFLTTPLLNAFSRILEGQADKFSIDLTKNPNGFVSMMQKLGDLNLAEFSPSRFNEIMFYDHPPIEKRIKFAQDIISQSSEEA